MSATALDRIRLGILAGQVPTELAGLPPRAARALRVAGELGAPMVPALAAARAALDQVHDRERAVHVATAQARTVGAVLAAAPLVLLPALARLLGVDVVGFYTRPLGAVVLAVGGALVLAGWMWIRHAVRRVGAPPRVGRGWSGVLVAVPAGLLLGWPAAVAVGAAAAVRARRTGPDPPPARRLDEAVDLVATALEGGAGTAAALRTAAAHVPGHAAALRRLALSMDLGSAPAGGDAGDAPGGTAATGLGRIATVLVAADRLGAPAVAALRDLARDLRADEHARALAAAARLPVVLTFPTALCLLPGSVLLVGAPLVVTGLTAAGL